MRPDKVLLVDDEVEFVEALAERMRVRGLEVETATDGYQAVEKAGASGFDAVVLDLAMPGMDGIQTLRQMRGVNPDLQVILLTGRATVQSAAEATRLGAVDVFEKPTDIEALLERIRDARATRLALDDRRTHEEIKEILRTKGW